MRRRFRVKKNSSRKKNISGTKRPYVVCDPPRTTDEKSINSCIVPWRNPAEFNKVFDYAYSDDLAKNRWAVEQIAVWETRVWPTLPFFIEVTHAFLRSKIQDQLYEANKSLCHTQEVEMMYANSVIRFVNLILESDKSYIHYRSAAEMKNIPSWIVDIRHSATHGVNPSLPMLRLAHEFIMSYLEEAFWHPMSTRIGCIIKTVDEAPMIELWQDYRRLRYEMIVANYKMQSSHGPLVQKVLNKMGYYLSHRKTRKTLVNVLVREFVPNDVLPLVEDDKILNDPSMTKAASLTDNVKFFYFPVIYLMHEHDLLSTFLEQLLLHQDKRPMKIQQLLVDLIVVNLLDMVQNPLEHPLRFVKPFIQKGVNFNMYRLLYSCVQGCSSSARLVFEKLVNDLQIKGWASDLSAMMSIKQGKYVECCEPRSRKNERHKRKFDITFTVEDLEEDINEAMFARKYKKKSPWSLAPLSINWESIPLGHVFHPVEVTVKEESKTETEIKALEDDANIYSNACEESKPIEKVQSESFIFSEKPKFSSMIY